MTYVKCRLPCSPRAIFSFIVVSEPLVGRTDPFVNPGSVVLGYVLLVHWIHLHFSFAAHRLSNICSGGGFLSCLLHSRPTGSDLSSSPAWWPHIGHHILPAYAPAFLIQVKQLLRPDDPLVSLLLPPHSVTPSALSMPDSFLNYVHIPSYDLFLGRPISVAMCVRMPSRFMSVLFSVCFTVLFQLTCTGYDCAPPGVF